LLIEKVDGGVRAFDDLAMGLESGTISRGKAIKLGGAALVASTLGLLTSQRADAQVEPAVTRRGCRRAFRRSDFCRSKTGGRCRICCNRKSRHPKACCGTRECNCCRRAQTCNERGECE
jgi:hypothetical protein